MNQDENNIDRPCLEDDSSTEEITLAITSSDLEEFRRLDRYLSFKLASFSRTFLKSLFLGGLIKSLNGVALKLSQMPPVGTKITLEIPPPIDSHLKAEDISLDILYEDEHLLFINKKAGMVTHPAPGNYSSTLVNALLYHCRDLTGIGNVKRPGIVHRLDKGTSGVMVVAKNMPTFEGLVSIFSHHNLERKYEAIVVNHKESSHCKNGKIETFFARDPYHKFKMKAYASEGEASQRKKAITYYRELAKYSNFSHMEFQLETGRTHQIRVHASQILNRPLLMDPLYSAPKSQFALLKGIENEKLLKILDEAPDYPFLHAKSLKLIHPILKKELFFEVPPPPPFASFLQELRTRPKS